MSSLSTDNLAELIDEKLRVLCQLHKVGQQQAEFADAGEVSKLLTLLAEKQTLITALQAVEGRLAPFRSEDPDGRIWASADHRARCAQQANDCNRLLKEILYLEKQSEDRMIARRDQVAQQIDQVNSACRMRGAYAANSSTAPQPSHRKESVATPPTRTDTASGGLDLVSDTH